MTTTTARALSAALFIAAIAAPASAQVADDPSNTRGLSLGLHTGGYGVAYEGDRDGSGGGLGFQIGYGFSDRFTGYLGFDAASISEGDGFEGLRTGDDYTFIFMDLGGRFHFRPDSRWVPFLDVAGTVVGLGFDNMEGQETTLGGASLSLGAGLLYYVSPTLALEGGASFSGGSLMEREIAGSTTDVDVKVAGVRMQVGVSYRPFR